MTTTPAERSPKQDDKVEMVRCLECGHVQADMGNNVQCENCGACDWEEAEAV